MRAGGQTGQVSRRLPGRLLSRFAVSCRAGCVRTSRGGGELGVQTAIKLNVHRSVCVHAHVPYPLLYRVQAKPGECGQDRNELQDSRP